MNLYFVEEDGAPMLIAEENGHGCVLSQLNARNDPAFLDILKLRDRFRISSTEEAKAAYYSAAGEYLQTVSEFYGTFPDLSAQWLEWEGEDALTPIKKLLRGTVTIARL